MVLRGLWVFSSFRLLENLDWERIPSEEDSPFGLGCITLEKFVRRPVTHLE
jgi:hypothetical protein